VLSREDAISFGCTGGTGRASGWACDVRKRMPYGVYDKVDFKEIVYTEGDSFARYMVRMDEIMESLKIIEQLIDNIPEGPIQEKMKPIIRVPEGSYYTAVEGSRGEFGVFLESHGDKTPYRLHYRSTGLPLVSAVDTICRGAKIADLIAAVRTQSALEETAHLAFHINKENSKYGVQSHNAHPDNDTFYEYSQSLRHDGG